MKWIGRIFKLFVPFLGAILGLIAANNYNFFETLPFVPKESEYDGMAEMQVIVRLVGKKEHFKDTKITLCDTGFITLQPSIHSSSISIAANGDCVIDLSALTGNAPIIDIKQSFRIVMQENVPDGSRTMSLKPNINKNNFFLKYNCNHAIIQVEGR